MTLLNWPNRISLLRIVLVVPFIICVLNLSDGWWGWRHLALAVFVLMALSDALDGFLARRLKQESILGRYLDPIGDKLLIASALILLAREDTAVDHFRLPPWVAVVAIGKDVLILIGFGLLYLVTRRLLIEPRFAGKSCTLVQLILVTYILAGPDLPGVLWRLFPLLYWLATALAVIATAEYIVVGNRFAAELSDTELTERR